MHPDKQPAEPLSAVTAAINNFQSVSLEQLGAAALMDRIDRKFLVSAASLPDILRQLADQYSVLNVNGQQLFHYSTRYFDTPDLALYHAHHSGRARRYKVRVRNYNDAEAGYLEVKLKNNRGRTQKQRVQLASRDTNPMEQLGKESLLGVNDSVPVSNLRESMLAEFTRLTLVRKDAAERITFDLMLSFSHDGKRRTFPEVVVAEIKQATRARSPFLDAMHTMNVREGSISKYCAGIATLVPGAKSNRFREFLRRLDTFH
jgi:hypothetical protein